MKSVTGSKTRQSIPRFHPLAVSALVLSLIGIPIMGVVLGPIAALMALVALAQIAGNASFRGQGLAVAAVWVGVLETAAWVAFLGLVVPRVDVFAARHGPALAYPSPHSVESAQTHIRNALEANVFLLVQENGWPAFLNSEQFTGSGIIIGKSGSDRLILTSRHVVDSSFVLGFSRSHIPPASVTVFFHDGRTDKARVCWLAPDGIDLALVGTGPDPLGIQVVTRYPPRDPEIGDRTFVVGNPHDLRWTYTEGVVSAIRAFGRKPDRLKIIQTQAPINRGSSGGGLYQSDGTLIGIVSWTEDKSQAEGIGFAIAYENFLRLYGLRKSDADIHALPGHNER